MREGREGVEAREATGLRDAGLRVRIEGMMEEGMRDEDEGMRVQGCQKNEEIAADACKGTAVEVDPSQ